VLGESASFTLVDPLLLGIAAAVDGFLAGDEVVECRREEEEDELTLVPFRARSLATKSFTKLLTLASFSGASDLYFSVE
jgi:hypothetical protein